MANPSESTPKRSASRARAYTSQRSPNDISNSPWAFPKPAHRDDNSVLPSRKQSVRNHSRPSTSGEGRDKKGDKVMDMNPDRVPDRPRPGNTRANTQPVQMISPELQITRLNQLEIGMALGSPSHNPWAHNGGSPPGEPSIIGTASSTTFSTSSPYNPTASSAEESNKHKGKWKMFGSLFSKRSNSHPTTPASPFYNVVTEVRNQKGSIPRSNQSTAARNMTHRRHSSRSLDKEISASKEQREADDGRIPKSKPLVSRHHTTPNPQHSPLPPPKDSKVLPAASFPRRDPQNAPVLHVDIPDTAMERYSIMFGNVLQPKRSSLMVRRHAQLEKLKVVDDFPSSDTSDGQELLLPIRRATLPSPGKSPSYSLFPHPPDRKPSPLSLTANSRSRSATAPSASPAQATFPKHVPNVDDQSQMLFTVNSPSPGTESPETPDGPTWHSDVSPLSAESFPLNDGELNPRDQTGDIFIRLVDTHAKKPTKVETARIKTTPTPTASVTRQKKKAASQVVPPPDTSRNKLFSPVTSPNQHPDRLSSLASMNKPLPSPLAAIESEQRQAREPRNGSLPAYLEPNHDSQAPRKGSLPVNSTRVVDLRPVRMVSLASRSTRKEHQHEHQQKQKSSQQPQQSQQQSKSRETSTQHRALNNHSRNSSIDQNEQLTLSTNRSAPQPPQSTQSRTMTKPASSEQLNSKSRDTTKSSQSLPFNPLKSSPASAAEISIARQISVSRRQQLMIPIVPKTVRQQQAKLVVPKEREESKSRNGVSHVSRKSTHGLLETA